MKERKIDFKIGSDTIDKLRVAFEENKDVEFFETFISENRVHNLDIDKVLSLALIEALHYGQENLIGLILNHPHGNNILTYINHKGYSALSVFIDSRLSNQNIWDLLQDYLKSKEENTVKTKLKGETFLRFYSLMHSPLFDLMTASDNIAYLRKEFLNYCYTADTLDHLENSISSSFNAKDYQEKGHDVYFSPPKSVSLSSSILENKNEKTYIESTANKKRKSNALDFENMLEKDLDDVVNFLSLKPSVLKSLIKHNSPAFKEIFSKSPFLADEIFKSKSSSKIYKQST